MRGGEEVEALTLEAERRDSDHTVPVGVFEADAGLFQLVRVLQLGHVLGVDGRLGHGLLRNKRPERRSEMRQKITMS